ncbi:MAG: hypothetical protein KAS32_26045 [Candidatus Peribacteraceae bacterium]|nr:hypothetical protein [Candidatus Peribacteraceae bacterium]
MDDKKIEDLNNSAQMSTDIRNMCKSPGWKLLNDKLEARIKDKRHLWLRAKTADSAEIIRLKTSTYQDVFDIITKIILEGDNARRTLADKAKISKNPE